MNMKHTRREHLYFFLFRVIAAASVAILIFVVALLWTAGHEVLSWQFLTAPWSHRDITQAGIMPAIIGSLYLGLGVLIASFPLGLATAIYLTEYSGEHIWKRSIELAIRNLAGIPSIVYGLFGFAVFAQFLGFGGSLLSAALTLAVMTLPWVITASVEAFKTVPNRFRESSMALGATRWETIREIVLPAALPGAITGAIIGFSRAMGETAPIIVVGATFYLSTLPASPLDKFMALPYHTFILATQHASPLAGSYAAATALVLIALTFVLSLGTIIIRYAYRQRKDW